MKLTDPLCLPHSTQVYHVPKTSGAAVELEGKEGVVALDVSEYKGQPTSATMPIRVTFTEPTKFIAHLVGCRFSLGCHLELTYSKSPGVTGLPEWNQSPASDGAGTDSLCLHYISQEEEELDIVEE